MLMSVVQVHLSPPNIQKGGPIIDRSAFFFGRLFFFGQLQTRELLLWPRSMVAGSRVNVKARSHAVSNHVKRLASEMGRRQGYIWGNDLRHRLQVGALNR